MLLILLKRSLRLLLSARAPIDRNVSSCDVTDPAAAFVVAAVAAVKYLNHDAIGNPMVDSREGGSYNLARS